MSGSVSPTLPQIDHTPCYCEENVYLLLQQAVEPARDDLFAVMISNPSRTVFVHEQSAVEPRCIVWDYHCIALSRERVYDFSSQLPWGIAAAGATSHLMEGGVDSFIWRADYVDRTWPPQICRRLPERFDPYFRVLAARDYLAVFASDRSHMRNSGQAEPPYPPITSQYGTNTLPLLWDVERTDLGERFGRLMGIVELRAFVTRPP